MTNSSHLSVYDKDSATSSETLVPKVPSQTATKDYEAAAASLMSHYGFNGRTPVIHACSARSPSASGSKKRNAALEYASKTAREPRDSKRGKTLISSIVSRLTGKADGAR